MTKEIDEEIVIDFKKIFKILLYRKELIMKVFTVCFLLMVLSTFITAKKYEADADLYINKTNNTNLAELNPYVIASLMNYGGGLSGMLSGACPNGLQNEIEIMQSPLVMDNVIRENHLRYTKGKKKGEFLSVKDFLKKGITIENKKGTNVVSISYKSRNPVLNYNIINSIIKNYEKVNTEINTKKAVKDKAFLETSYADTNKTLNQKLSAMKNSSAMPATAMNSLGMLAALKGHNKAVSGAIGSIQNQVVESQKSQIAVDQEVEKLKLVKSKLEWTNLVEKMSKDTTNVIILKQPELKRKFEKTSPSLKINIILGIVFGVIISMLAVILAEVIDKKLTYSKLNNKIIYDPAKNIDKLILMLLTNSKETISFLVFDGFQAGILKNLGECTNFKIINADITLKVIDEIKNSDKLVFMAKIGQTPNKIYKQMKDICEEIQKPVYAEVV